MSAFGNQRKENFKKGVDQDDARRRREETTIQIRKSKKEERLNKRRTGGYSNIAGQPSVPQTMPMGTPLQQGSDPQLMQRLQELPAIVNGVLSNDTKLHLDATTQFRKLLSIERNPPIQAVIDAGVVP